LQPELDAVRRWRRVISHVATQEMLHLALVQKLFAAIGAAPHLSRPNSFYQLLKKSFKAADISAGFSSISQW